MLLSVILFTSCSRSGDSPAPVPPTPVPPLTNEIDFWLTKSDESIKLQKQATVLAFGTTVNQYASIEVDELNRRELFLDYSWRLIDRAVDYSHVVRYRSVLIEYRIQATSYRPLRIEAGYNDRYDGFARSHELGLGIAYIVSALLRQDLGGDVLVIFRAKQSSAPAVSSAVSLDQCCG